MRPTHLVHRARASDIEGLAQHRRIRGRSHRRDLAVRGGVAAVFPGQARRGLGGRGSGGLQGRRQHNDALSVPLYHVILMVLPMTGTTRQVSAKTRNIIASVRRSAGPREGGGEGGKGGGRSGLCCAAAWCSFPGLPRSLSPGAWCSFTAPLAHPAARRSPLTTRDLPRYDYSNS